jgi:hypothetical protein
MGLVRWFASLLLYESGQAETYLMHVAEIESGLGPLAFRSESVTTFVDGSDAHTGMQDLWCSDDGAAGLPGRTPLMLERDRILPNRTAPLPTACPSRAVYAARPRARHALGIRISIRPRDSDTSVSTFS